MKALKLYTLDIFENNTLLIKSAYNVDITNNPLNLELIKAIYKSNYPNIDF